MGVIRKAASISTLGGVKYTSRREAQTKAALAQAKVAKEEAKRLRSENGTGPNAKWDAILDSIRNGEIMWADVPRLQKLAMPLAYQIKCKAADRKNGVSQ
jgi:hypothetical protein